MKTNRHLKSLRKKLTKVAGSEKLISLARDQSPAETTEAALEATPGTRMAPLFARSAKDEYRALQKLENGDFEDLTPREEMHLEAIVEEEGRQVAFIEGGQYKDLPSPWTHFNGTIIRQRIEKTIPWIGRVEIPASFAGDTPKHLGTGFIVGSNLMMTNRHVAELFVRGIGRRRLSFVTGVAAAIDFKREKDFAPEDNSSSIAITDIVMVHPYWDMALFRVDGLTGTGLPLSVVSPEDLIDREIAVIGYPGRGRDRSAKAVALERKYFGTTFGVKRIAPGEIREREKMESFDHFVSAMTHDSSTLPGNSGAAILDVQTGEVVGLHFAGITLKANYAVPAFELARDRRVVDAGVHFRGQLSPTNEWENYWKVADPEGEATTPITTVKAPEQRGASGERGSTTITIPLTISVSLGTPPTSPASVTLPQASPAAKLVEASFQIPIIHPGLEERDGYDPRFLGADKVPLPALTTEGKKAVSLLQDNTFELKYHRFSVVMHKKRRLALFTAANVNWQRSSRLVNGRKPSRDELTGIPEGVLEEWVMDPRIPEADQLPDLFFTKDKGAFDKGHLVRRDDVAWGVSFDDIQKGNGDTYHTTNCSPQVNHFNQGSKGEDNWGDLEDMIQRRTATEKVCVFSGPVLSKSDRIFKGVSESGLIKIQIPQQFWKIVVAKTNAGPRAFGFVLKQKLTGVPLEFTVPEDWEPFQTPIAEIEELMFGLVSLEWFKERDVLQHEF